MSFLKKLVFKLMELGLGLRPYFSLQTRNPVFVNFRLDEAEAAAVRAALPAGFELRAIRFVASDPEPAHWLSYNLYELRYPRPEMAAIRKIRCEVNTFVRDASGRDGVFVFCGSPFVSREEERTTMGKVADFAERLVIWLYGCGRLTRVRYELGEGELRIDVDEPEAQLALHVDHAPTRDATERLADDYVRFNDVSFFAGGQSFDEVSVNSAFVLATFSAVEPSLLPAGRAHTSFFERAPDRVYVHRGDVGYLVSAMHRPASGA
jgi:hypothetical protein